jgi:hypothetical protein
MVDLNFHLQCNQTEFDITVYQSEQRALINCMFSDTSYKATIQSNSDYVLIKFFIALVNARVIVTPALFNFH